MESNQANHMNKLNREDLYSLEQYAEIRPQFRAEIMEYKKKRQLPLGKNARLYFESKATIQYQIQEVLRVEKTFDAAGIEEELEAYNPLIPDGSNLKATFMLEYPDATIREQKTVELRGIEYKVWLQVEDCEKVFAIADEDLARDDGSRTSTVHFMRYELAPTMIVALKKGASLAAGIDHETYTVVVNSVPTSIRESLTEDLDDRAVN
jgi:hypothetical protein